MKTKTREYPIPAIPLYTEQSNGFKYLRFLFHTCLKYIEKNLSEDYSYYNGSLGVLKFLHIASEFYGNEDKVQKLICKYINEIKADKILNLDIIAGISGIGISLVREYDRSVKIKQIVDKIFDILTAEIRLEQRSLRNVSLTDNISFAHGKIGVGVFLYYYYVHTSNELAYELLEGIINECNMKKLSNGWIDKRNSKEKSSAHWCHGSTGVLIAMLEILEADRINRLLDKKILKSVKESISHALKNILNIGLNIENFSLCHGISGNLLSLLLFLSSNVEFDCKEDIAFKVKEVTFDMINKGLNNNWLSGYGTIYNTYGLFTGLSGILFFLIFYKYERNFIAKRKENILMPTAVRG